MKKSLFIILAFLGAVFLTTSTQSCYTDNEEELYGGSASCDTASIKYAASVAPIITSKCGISGCHNAATPSAGADLSTYAATKLYVTNGKDFFLGSIRHTTGFSQMPKGGSKMATCDIAKIEAWVNAGMPNN